MILLMIALLSPAQPASSNQNNLQMANFIDWKGFSLSASSGFTQSITPLYVPSASQGVAEWALNVGNGSHLLAPTIFMSSTNMVHFGFFDVSSDARYTQVGNTTCSINTPNAFGTTGTFSASCATPLQVRANETYKFTLLPVTSSLLLSWNAKVEIHSDGRVVDLGTIRFNVETSKLNSSINMRAFNQTSTYSSSEDCNLHPRADAIYSRPQGVGSSVITTPSLLGFRPAAKCPQFKLEQNTDGSIKALIGSIGSSYNPSGNQTNVNHQGAEYVISYVPTYLNQNNSLELDFKPLVMNGNSGLSTKLNTFYGIDWCWQTKDSLKGTQACASFHIELWDEFARGYRGNADFFFQHAIAATPINNDTRCELRQETPIAGQKAFYTPCWQPVVIEPNNEYTLKVYADPQGENWWRALLLNKSTGSSIEVGRIQAVANLQELPLASLTTEFAYTGSKVSCDDVPINDTVYSLIRDGKGKEAALKSNRAGSCGQFKLGRLKSDSSKLLVTHGGSDAQTRNSSLYLSSNSQGSSSNSGGNQAVTPSKPQTPTLSGINFVGNKVEVNVNLGSTNRSDSVILIAPGLFAGNASSAKGTISGNNASWRIPLSAALSGKFIPLTIIGSANGIDSEPLLADLQIPKLENKEESKLAPSKPTNLRSSFIGTDLVVTAQIETSGNSVPDKGFIYSTQLGITKAKPIKGEIIGNKIAFSLPIKQRQLGSNVRYEIFTSNSIGTSPISAGSHRIPKLQVGKIPSIPVQTKTVSCRKGNSIRTFAASKCPPGWGPA